MMSSERRLRVCSLGAFAVFVDDINITQKYRLAKKPWVLFKYLLSNKDKIVSIDDLADAVELTQFDSNTSQLLCNLIYRLRYMLGETGGRNKDNSEFVYENSGYKWKNSGNTWFDAEVFESFCKNALEMQSAEPKERMEYCDKAIALYKGDFMAENVNDDWTYSARTYYKNLFSKVLQLKIQNLNLLAKYDEIIEICKNVLLVNYYNTDIHTEYLKALLEKNNILQALTHYEEATQKLYTQVGILPPPEMVAIYKNIKKGKKDVQLSISEVKNELKMKCKDKGALMCDADIFTFLYNLEKNIVSRYNQSAYIVSLTIVYINDTGDSNQMNNSMKTLGEVLVNTLRKADVMTKWSSCQYLLLLYKLEQNDIEIVFKRISDEFFKIVNNDEIMIIKSISNISD